MYEIFTRTRNNLGRCIQTQIKLEDGIYYQRSNVVRGAWSKWHVIQGVLKVNARMIKYSPSAHSEGDIYIKEG